MATWSLFATRSGPVVGRGLAVVLLPLLMACGPGPTPRPSVVASAAAPPSASAEPAVPSSPAASRSPSPTARATQATSTTFESRVYPYTWTLPGGVLLRNWTAATVPWDGESPINRSTNRVDVTGTKLGSLLVVGVASTDAESLGALMEGNTSRFNGCKLTSEPKAIDVNGVPGVTFAQLCAQGTTALTVAVVKDAYGLVVRIVEYSAPDQTILAELRQWMAGLTWPVRG